MPESTAGSRVGAAAEAGEAPADTLRLDHQLCFALYAASLAMTRAYRPLLAAIGLTYPQFVVMLALWQHGELSMGALGERVALDSGTLVPLLAKLRARGWVERRRSRSDDRSVLISLTPAGEALRAQAARVQAQVECATRLPADERQALVHGLHGLRATLLATAAPPADRAAAAAAPRDVAA